MTSMQICNILYFSQRDFLRHWLAQATKVYFIFGLLSLANAAAAQTVDPYLLNGIRDIPVQLTYNVGEPLTYYPLEMKQLGANPVAYECFLEVEPQSGLDFVSIDCQASSVSWYTDTDSNQGEYWIRVTKTQGYISSQTINLSLTVLAKIQPAYESLNVKCQPSSLQLITPLPKLADVIYDASEPTGQISLQPFDLRDVNNNLCPQDSVELLVTTDQERPLWLQITSDSATSTVQWSAAEAPAGFQDSFTVVILVTANGSEGTNILARTQFKLLVFSPVQFKENSSIINETKPAAKVFSYTVGEPVLIIPIGDLSAQCGSRFLYDACEVSVAPTSGSRCFKLADDKVEVATDELSCIGSYLLSVVDSLEKFQLLEFTVSIHAPLRKMANTCLDVVSQIDAFAGLDNSYSDSQIVIKVSTVNIYHTVTAINDQKLSPQGWKLNLPYKGLCGPEDIVKTNTLNTLKGAKILYVALGGGVSKFMSFSIAAAGTGENEINVNLQLITVGKTSEINFKYKVIVYRCQFYDWSASETTESRTYIVGEPSYEIAVDSFPPYQYKGDCTVDDVVLTYTVVDPNGAAYYGTEIAHLRDAIGSGSKFTVQFTSDATLPGNWILTVTATIKDVLNYNPQTWSWDQEWLVDAPPVTRVITLQVEARTCANQPTPVLGWSQTPPAELFYTIGSEIDQRIFLTPDTYITFLSSSFNTVTNEPFCVITLQRDSVLAPNDLQLFSDIVSQTDLATFKFGWFLLYNPVADSVTINYSYGADTHQKLLTNSLKVNFIKTCIGSLNSNNLKINEISPPTNLFYFLDSKLTTKIKIDWLQFYDYPVPYCTIDDFNFVLAEENTNAVRQFVTLNSMVLDWSKAKPAHKGTHKILVTPTIRDPELKTRMLSPITITIDVRQRPNPLKFRNEPTLFTLLANQTNVIDLVYTSDAKSEISIDLANWSEVATYELVDGLIRFIFNLPVGQNFTDSKLKITVVEIYDAEKNPEPLTTVRDVLVVIYKAAKETEQENQTKQESTNQEFQPVLPVQKYEKMLAPYQHMHQVHTHISKVSAYGTGHFRLKLNETIKLPQDYHTFTETNSSRHLLPEYGLDQSAIGVKVVSHQKDKNLYDDLSYQFISISASHDELFFAIQYPRATQVSKGKKPDILVVTINKPAYFIGNVSNHPIFTQSQQFKHDIPMQHPSEMAHKISEAIATGASSSAVTVMVVTVIAQFLGKSVIKRLWSSFLVVQLLTAVYYHNKEHYPANASQIYDSIKNVLEMSALPKDQILDYIFQSYKENLIPEDGLLYKLGVFGAILALLIIVIGLLALVKYIITKLAKHTLARVLQIIVDKICWNIVIKTFQGGFIGYALHSLSTFVHIKDHGVADIVVSSFMLAALVLVVVSVGKYLWKKPNYVLDDPLTRRKIGALYSELNVHSKHALLQTSFFYVLRLIAALLLAGFCPVTIQLHALTVLTLLQLCFIHAVKPYVLRDGGQQRLELLIQYSLYVIFVIKIAFSGMIQDPELEYTVGWLQTGFVAFFIFANACNLIPPLVKDFKRFLHRKKCEKIIRQNQKRLQENFEREINIELHKLREQDKLKKEQEQAELQAKQQVALQLNSLSSIAEESYRNSELENQIYQLEARSTSIRPLEINQTDRQFLNSLLLSEEIKVNPDENQRTAERSNWREGKRSIFEDNHQQSQPTPQLVPAKYASNDSIQQKRGIYDSKRLYKR